MRELRLEGMGDQFVHHEKLKNMYILSSLKGCHLACEESRGPRPKRYHAIFVQGPCSKGHAFRDDKPYMSHFLPKGWAYKVVLFFKMPHSRVHGALWQ